MKRKIRRYANTNVTPRPLSDSEWLAQNFLSVGKPVIPPPPVDPEDAKMTLAETRLMVGEAPVDPVRLAGMHRIELARQTWAETHFEEKEPHLRTLPFLGPRFEPKVPGYARRKQRFAQR
jgi:hypothetical protein